MKKLTAENETRGVTNEKLENAFKFHPATTEEAVTAHERVREALKEVAYLITDLTPVSREQSLALTKLEEAMFWSNASIARESK